MASQHLYNFNELMVKGVQDANGVYQPVSKLRVPRIQRSYAQGRESEKDIRESFLNEIFAALNAGTPLAMNFVYGSFNNGIFDVLDGQQRLTTLFLVYWYILKEENCSVSWMGHFAYQTRKTSTDFIQKLVNDTFVFTKNPSQTIRGKKWFVLSYRQDSTVMTMINMLDAIHEKYQSIGKVLSQNLDKLQFYLIPLDQYGLTEDLYIKMNARGLRLTSFDNFKADLINYLRNGSTFSTHKVLQSGITHRSVPYYLYFPICMDNSWIDLFWKRDQKNYDKLFFRFFYRYMASKYITQISANANYDTMKDDPDYLFFATISETQQDKYKGFILYYKYLSPNLIYSMEKVLDLLKDHYASDIVPNLTSPWGDNALMFDEPGPQKFNRKSQVVFSAVIEYLDRCTTANFSRDDFDHWMRVVWNMIENSNIDGLRPQMAVMRRMVDMLNQGIVGNIYSGLASYTGTNMSAAATEEIEKAKLIIRPNTNWEASLINAEKDMFLKGMVSFFCDNFSSTFTEREFDARYSLISKIFDQNGITKEFRADRLLMRALLSCVREWWGNDGMKDLRFTESVEKDTFLKNLIRQNKNVWNLFNEILMSANSLSVNDVKYRLIQKVTYHSYCNSNALPNDGGNTGRPGQVAFEKSYNRLISDTRLLDWIRAEEKRQGKYFKIYYAYFHVWATIPGAQYSRVMLDSNRDHLINMLRWKQDFEYDEEGQQWMYNAYGFHTGFDVMMHRYYKGRKIIVQFRWNNILSVGVKYDDQQDLAQLSTIFGATALWGEKYLLVTSLDYSSFSWNEIDNNISLILSKI